MGEQLNDGGGTSTSSAVAAAVEILSRTETGKASNENFVTLDVPISTGQDVNPKEWPRIKKWRAVAIGAMMTFISPITSSMVAPALPYLATDLEFTSTIEIEMSLSIFVLAFALGPLILAPLSEVYGRRKILMLSMAFFTIFNAACGAAQSKTQMLLFRFMAGIGGSAPVAISGSIVSDTFARSEMGTAMSYYVLGIILGPAIGPIIGGFLTQALSWRWLFYIISIVSGFVLVVAFFFLPESYGPYLVLRASLQADKLAHVHHPKPNVFNVLRDAIVRPFILLFTQPISQIIAIFVAFFYGVMYIVLTTFSALYTKNYSEATQISTLHYFSLGLGFLIANRFSGGFLDVLSVYMQKRNNTPHKPEYRLILCIPGVIFLPIGIFIYGWAAEYTLHWIVTDIGVMLFTTAVGLSFQACSLYTVDVYTRYAASALAATTSLRSLAGFGFPLFAQDMYDSLGYGWGNSVLGFIAFVFGVPAPILLYIYGERIREKSKFAIG
ncbi:hypothetical protein HK100_001515 [Physocladia obscura]|uniref:Major facilitator superfamily (MFS) profile domain-containing protein n=1 Tax=Physocladia obscura TaxID=109957 RepID=A0AAD5XJP2_9FUNG|nr:hypothetical protein HK100_001515 [Physocladia obscura]